VGLAAKMLILKWLHASIGCVPAGVKSNPLGLFYDSFSLFIFLWDWMK
jgi:hypothetical protein